MPLFRLGGKNFRDTSEGRKFSEAVQLGKTCEAVSILIGAGNLDESAIVELISTVTCSSVDGAAAVLSSSLCGPAVKLGLGRRIVPRSEAECLSALNIAASCPGSCRATLINDLIEEVVPSSFGASPQGMVFLRKVGELIPRGERRPVHLPSPRFHDGIHFTNSVNGFIQLVGTFRSLGNLRTLEGCMGDWLDKLDLGFSVVFEANVHKTLLESRGAQAIVLPPVSVTSCAILESIISLMDDSPLNAGGMLEILSNGSAACQRLAAFWGGSRDSCGVLTRPVIEKLVSSEWLDTKSDISQCALATLIAARECGHIAHLIANWASKALRDSHGEHTIVLTALIGYYFRKGQSRVIEELSGSSFWSSARFQLGKEVLLGEGWLRLFNLSLELCENRNVRVSLYPQLELFLPLLLHEETTTSCLAFLQTVLIGTVSAGDENAIVTFVEALWRDLVSASTSTHIAVLSGLSSIVDGAFGGRKWSPMRSRLQHTLAHKGKCVLAWQTVAASKRSVPAIVGIYNSLTRFNPDVVALFSNTVSARAFVSRLLDCPLGAQEIDEALKLCDGGSDTQQTINTIFLPHIAEMCTTPETRDTLLNYIVRVSDRSRMVRYQLATCSTLDFLIDGFCEMHENEKVRQCISAISGHFIRLPQVKQMCVNLMKARENRYSAAAAMTALFADCLRESCQPDGIFRNYFALDPSRGPGTVKVKIPMRNVDTYVDIGFGFSFPTTGSWAMCELRTIDGARKGEGRVVSLGYEGSWVLVSEGRTAKGQAIGCSNEGHVAIHVYPSKIISQGRVVVHFNGSVCAEMQAPITGDWLLLTFGEEGNGAHIVPGWPSFGGFISEIKVNGLGTDGRGGSRVLPSPFSPRKVTITGSTGVRGSCGGFADVGECRGLGHRVVELGAMSTIVNPLLMLLDHIGLPFTQEQLRLEPGWSLEEMALGKLFEFLSLGIIHFGLPIDEVADSGFALLLIGVFRRRGQTLSPRAFIGLQGVPQGLGTTGAFDAFVVSVLFDMQLFRQLGHETRCQLLDEVSGLSSSSVLRGRLRECGLIRWIEVCFVECAGQESDREREYLLKILDAHLPDRLSEIDICHLVGLLGHVLRLPLVTALELTGLCSACLAKKHILDMFFRTDLEGILVGLIDRPEEELRHEGVKLFILYGSQSHPERSLSFLASKLLPYGLTKTLYDTLVSACQRIPGSKRKRWLLNWPSIILPVLMLAEDAEANIRREVLADFVSLLKVENAIAWASVIRLPCWYVYLCDLAIQEEGASDIGLVIEPLVAIFSKALRSCNFYEQELRRTIAYFALRNVPGLKHVFMARLLEDAQATDPSAVLMHGNTLHLLGHVEMDLLVGYPTARVVSAYLQLATSQKFVSRVFPEGVIGAQFAHLLHVMLRAPQLAVEEQVLISAVRCLCDEARKLFQSAPEWLSISNKYRVVVQASAHILLVSSSFAALESLCTDYSAAIGVKGSVSRDQISKDPGLMASFKLAFDGLPAIQDHDGPVAIGELHTLMSEASLTKEEVLRQYSDALGRIENGLGSCPFVTSDRQIDEALSAFSKRCEENIWRPSVPNGHFLRHLPREQMRLRSFKLVRDPKGTDHADVSTRTDVRNDSTTTRRPTTLGATLDAEDFEEPLLPSDEDEDSKDASDQAVFACELVHFIHCYTCELRIVGQRLDLVPAEENVAYNQTVSRAAQRFVTRPSKTSWMIKDVSSVTVGRRYRMQRSAVELRFSDLSVVMLSFAPEDYRKIVARIRRWGVPIDDPDRPQQQNERRRITDRWRNGELSNFDYLMELNAWAGRSKQDLSQYPVVPWVVSDYHSKELDLANPATYRDLRNPIGWTGTNSRKDELMMRFNEMQCHYFQHYSSPAVVLYYLLRLEPYTTMHIVFQGGRFDHADRLFYSVGSTWSGVRNNLQDVKELIPEFYYLPEAFQNHNGVFLGRRQDGAAINFLDLPPWANASPYEFVYRLRMALESDVVSSSLHHWIDLIFGYKQRGPEAVKAFNVFHPDTYEPKLGRRSKPIEVEVINSVDTVGQVPVQLFKKPHPERASVQPTGSSCWSDASAALAMVVLPADGDQMCCLRFAEDTLFVMRSDGSVWGFPADSSPLMARATRRFKSASSPVIEIDPASGTCVAEPVDGLVEGTPNNSSFYTFGDRIFTLHGGLFGSNIMARSITPERLADKDRVQRVYGAHVDGVHRVSVAEDGRTVVTVGWDSTIWVWSVLEGSTTLTPKFAIRSHPADVLDADCSTQLDMVASSSLCGTLLVHSVASGHLEWSDTHPQLGNFDIVKLVPSCFVPHVLVHSRSDNATRQYSINGVLLRVLTHERRVLGIFPVYGMSQATLFVCKGGIVMHHSFLFDTLMSYDVPVDVVDVAQHPRSPHVLFLGMRDGSVRLIKSGSV